ncbi:DUF427 domain-containing protein [Paraburkholderia fungorum]|uniref:DUF427 domain-containing protein n=1 Tax=Paraburkholderia fungorum TaxID=134537 RepID=UPI0038B7D52F
MSSNKLVKIPGPDHPITIEAATARVKVRVAGVTIANSVRALVLREASYSPVYYLPAADIDMSQLVPSSHTTYCPYKGDCGYHDIAVGGERSRNAVWSYGAPYDAVAAIAGHFAFYPDRVDGIEVGEAA